MSFWHVFSNKSELILNLAVENTTTHLTPFTYFVNHISLIVFYLEKGSPFEDEFYPLHYVTSYGSCYHPNNPKKVLVSQKIL